MIPTDLDKIYLTLLENSLILYAYFNHTILKSKSFFLPIRSKINFTDNLPACHRTIYLTGLRRQDIDRGVLVTFVLQKQKRGPKECNPWLIVTPLTQTDAKVVACACLFVLKMFLRFPTRSTRKDIIQSFRPTRRSVFSVRCVV